MPDKKKEPGRIQLGRLHWVSDVMDPIWNEIPITQIEKELIETREFNRLRNIKQLSFVYLAMPGARHTRFQHSIGTMHVADYLLKSIRLDIKQDQMDEIEERYRQLLRISALLHDIGHPPFSHALEYLFTRHPELIQNKDQAINNNHKYYTKLIIRNKEGSIYKILAKWFADADLSAIDLWIDMIADLACGQIKLEWPEGFEHRRRKIAIFKTLLDGDIDADKIDYLMRDNYYCGFPSRLYLPHLRDNLIVVKEREEYLLKIDTSPENPRRKQAISFTENILHARHVLVSNVHNIPHNIVATVKIIEILAMILKKKTNKSKLEFIHDIFTIMTDEDLIQMVFKYKGNPQLQDLISIFDEVLRRPSIISEYKEIKLDFAESYPSIRVGMHLLSDINNYRYIEDLQKSLREIFEKDTTRKDMVVDVYSESLLEYSMKFHPSGRILDDLINQGIMDESYRNCGVICFIRDYNEDVLSEYKEGVCVICKSDDGLRALMEEKFGGEWIWCIEELNPAQRIIAQELITIYRKIGRESNGKKIIVSDFFCLILLELKKLRQKIGLTQEQLYRISKLIAKELIGLVPYNHTTLKELFIGDIGLSIDSEEPTQAFIMELRRLTHLGFIDLVQKIEGNPNQTGKREYSFTNYYELSIFGEVHVDKVQYKHYHYKVFGSYLDIMWKRIVEILNELTILSKIDEILEIKRG